MRETNLITCTISTDMPSDIVLMPLNETLLPNLIEMINNDQIAPWLPFHKPFDENQARRLLALAEDRQNDYCAWMIQVGQNIVGTIIMQSQFHPGCLQLGYWVAPEFHRSGYATAAMKIVCDTAYHQFNAVRLQAQVHTDNIASIALLDKLGFKRESLMKLGAAKMNDTAADCYMYVQLKSEVM